MSTSTSPHEAAPGADSAAEHSSDPLTEGTRHTWSAGEFGRIAPSYARGAAEFISRLGLAEGGRLLDVACGTGNTALPASHAGAVVTGVDITTTLIEQARDNAAADGLSIRFDVGDCEQLPYPDGAFDVVVTMFGAMFAPRPDRVVSELTRVCRAGGRIVMANWAPHGFVGDMFRATAKHVAPPAGAPSPLLWGDERVVRERFGSRARSLQCTRRIMVLEFPFSPNAVVDHFREYYGPTLRAFESAQPDRREAMRADLEELWRANNRGTAGTTRVESEYLEVDVVLK
jgi:SAM-dependent methyltransferase